jgi:SAM-dependent methyltransferase
MHSVQVAFHPAQRGVRVSQTTVARCLIDSREASPLQHADHVALIEPGIADRGGDWADFGSGSGAFTLALADLLGPGGRIYSIDLDRRGLQRQRSDLAKFFPDTELHSMLADFTQPLNLPPLDGIVMANSLHFQHDKETVLPQVLNYLKPSGRLILVEYNADRGNRWVPYPLSYPTWEALSLRSGFVGTRLLATRPSRFLGEIYSAVSFRPAGTDDPVP